MTGKFTAIIGLTSDPEYAETLHHLAHAGKVEYLTISGGDLARKRLRATTDKGTDCAMHCPGRSLSCMALFSSLPRRGLIVVELQELPWLCFEASDRAAALRLGFLAGHHHWRVRFADTKMFVALDGPPAGYTDRLTEELERGSVQLVSDPDEVNQPAPSWCCFSTATAFFRVARVAFSFGLETLAQDGLVRDADDVRGFSLTRFAIAGPAPNARSWRLPGVTVSISRRLKEWTRCKGDDPFARAS